MRNIFPTLTCDADDFRTHFEQYGKVLEVQIMVDHISGRSRGFG